MRQKVSDYIADFLVKNEIREVFTVPGGLAMHMNDSFGHHENSAAHIITMNRPARWRQKPMHAWRADRRLSVSPRVPALQMPLQVYSADGWDLFRC